MTLKIKVKVVKVGNSLRMTIPKAVCESLDIKEGDTVAISVNDSQMVVESSKNI